MNKALPEVLYIASDHGGLELKSELANWVNTNFPDVQVEDLGPKRHNPQDDYPEFAQKLSRKLLSDLHQGRNSRGILLCRGGQGMAMAANRFRGIRASVVWSTEEAKATRQDNDSNVLSISADHIKHETVFDITKTWMETEFSGAQRHRRRILMLDQD